MTQPWDITRIEHDELGGPDIAHFADGYRMPLKRKTTLADFSFDEQAARENIRDLAQAAGITVEQAAEVARQAIEAFGQPTVPDTPNDDPVSE